MARFDRYVPVDYRNRTAKFRHRLVSCHSELVSDRRVARWFAALLAAEGVAIPAGEAGDQWGEAQDIWQGDPLPAVVGALYTPETVRLEPVLNLFRDMALVEHLEQGRRLRQELEDRFGGRLPQDFVAFAAANGRLGVLRPFGVRLGGKGVSEEAGRRILSRVERAKRFAHRLAELFLDYDIAAACRNCGAVLDVVEPAFCSPGCERRFERHEHYVNLAGDERTLG